MTQANKAHSVDAAIARAFHIVRHWRRATDVHRSAKA
jgi:hypothetical protein